jgi:3-methylfumaryl-CoA hydratase
MHEAVGRTQTFTDAMDPDRVAALHATLGLEGPAPGHYDPLPPFFHQVFFWDFRPPDELGRDGHPRIGGFIPDLGLPRRMWAGGRLAFYGPLRFGLTAQKTTTIESVEQKQGRTGPLAFITLRHDIVQGGVLRVSEHQDLVYREDPSPSTPHPIPPRAPDGAEQEIEFQFDTTLLFRYSALTFNGHRIHYDRDYARDVEGYPGLVVHGPLLAQLLMLVAASRGPLRQFSFRAHAPLIDTEPAVLCRAGDSLWVRGPENRLCMSAEVVHA